MSTLVWALILIGVGASALFVFVSTARLFVSPDTPLPADDNRTPSEVEADIGILETAGRAGARRRQGKVEFPLQLGDELVEHERRRLSGRRRG